MIEQLRLLRNGFLVNPASNRGQERLRRAGLSGITSMLSQGLAIATGLISVPLTVRYLGQERYGIWLIINSLMNWLFICNLGFGGNALINSLAEANGKDDIDLARELVATAFWSLIGIAALLTVILALAFPFVPWRAVFNASSVIPLSELKWAVTIWLVSFVLMFPISIVDAIYQSYQEGYIGNIWAIVGSVFSLIALIGVTQVRGGLPLLVLSLSGVRILVTIANLVYLLRYQYPWLFPTPRAATRQSLRRLLSLGLKYFIAQLAGIGMFQSQPMIIAQVLGPAQVGIFNIAYRLLTLPQTIVQMFVFPLMSAYGEAQARQDWPWVHNTLKRSLVGSGVVTFCLLIPLMSLTKPIVQLWAGPELVPSQPLIICLGIYVLLAGIVTPASVMLYGLMRVGGQALIAVTNGVVTVMAGIWLTKMRGLPGMAVAMAIGLLGINLVGQAIQVRIVLNSRTARDLTEVAKSHEY